MVEQLRNPRYIRSLGGVGIEAAVYGNPDSDIAKFVYYGWGGNFRHPNAQREAITMAHAEPDIAHVVVNGPGIGNSGMIPKSAQKEIMETGSFLPLGEYYAPVMQHIAEDYDTLLVNGHSLGARLATAATHYMEPGRVKEMRLHDPVGTREMSLGGLALNFIAKEGLENSRYESEALAPSAKDAGLQMLPTEHPGKIEIAKGAHLSPEEEALAFESPRFGLYQQFLVDTNGLRRKAFENDLRQSVANVERSIDIFSPDMSHLNDWRAISDIVGRLRSDPVEGMTADVTAWRVMNHTHANNNQPAPMAAYYTTDLSRGLRR